MKKRLFMLLVSTFSVACLLSGGCGKSEEQQRAEYYQNEMGLTKSEAEELARDVQSELNGGKSTVQSSEESGKGTEIVEYKLYPADDAWKSLTVADKGLQIDDKMYEPGSTIEDTLKIVDSSAEDYHYEYNPNKLIPASSREHIAIYKDDIEWIEIAADNYTDETMELSKCIVTNISVSNYTQNGVLPCMYARFIDGRTYQDLLSLSYSEVKDLAGTVFKDYPMKEVVRADKTIDIVFDGDVDSVYPQSRWIDKSLMVVNDYRFNIDPNTSMVNGFFCVNIGGFGGDLINGPYEPITKLSQIPKETVDEIYASEMKFIENQYPNCQVTFEGEAIQQRFSYGGNAVQGYQQVTHNKNEIHDVHDWNRLYKITKEDGSASYVCVELNDATLTFLGKCNCDSHLVSDEMSYEDAIKEYFSGDIKDSTIQ